MKLSIIFVRFGLREMEDAVLAHTIRHTQGPRELCYRVVDNWGNVESLTSLWHRAVSSEFLSGASYVTLLNSDAWVAPGWWTRIESAFQTDERIAVVGPSSNEGPARAASQIIPPSMVTSWQPNLDRLTVISQRIRQEMSDSIRDCEIYGHCWTVRRDAWSKMAGFAQELKEGYTLYGSESSFNRRCRVAGWRTVCAESAYVFHVGQLSGKYGEKEGIINLKAEVEKGLRIYEGRKE